VCAETMRKSAVQSVDSVALGQSVATLEVGVIPLAAVIVAKSDVSKNLAAPLGRTAV